MRFSNDWNYGLEKPNDYLASRGIEDVLEAFPAKEVTYMIGELDI